MKIERIFRVYAVLRQVFTILFLAGVALFVAQGAAYAQVSTPVVSPGCDVQFYNQLKGAAELKGAREMEAAQSIILKPDSVLHYSCFMQQVNNVRENLEFKQDMRGMSEAVADPFDRYLSINFSQNMGGGLAAPPPNADGPCYAMAQVWHTAKCNDFDLELFMPFNEVGADMRTFPQSCPGGRRIAGLQLDAKIPAGGPGAGDAMESYHDDLTTCGAPVPTGIDFVCLAPGCYYDGRTCRATPP